ncbi:hypothetical protein KYJ26_09960 [Bacillus sp. MCCB 382]|uniref:hypothetical protein n=1 Tax=Bacillus sp. MCCB 382 TaxID=2860197 RepID=UPI001C5865AC|nr:hypothetical protein [Bacillus sp. MCCB 382]
MTLLDVHQERVSTYQAEDDQEITGTIIPFLPKAETTRDTSLWNRFTIDTDERTANIQYRYRYKDAR